jgi:hypothetical protein
LLDQENKMFTIIYNNMVKISSSRNFQYKIVKNIVLSILVPAAIILFSAWFFFGDMWGKPAATKADATEATKEDENPTDSCNGMTQDKCNLDTCMWDPTQNMCLSSN